MIWPATNLKARNNSSSKMSNQLEEKIDFDSRYYEGGFKNKLKKSLENVGIITYEDLTKRSMADLWNIKGLGLKTIEAILKDLKDKGYSLRE